MLIVFLVAVYVLPLLLGLWVLLAGLGTRLSSRAFATVALPLIVLVGTFAYVYRQDGWTDYTRYLRLWVLVAAVGVLASALREGHERIAARR